MFKKTPLAKAISALLAGSISALSGISISVQAQESGAMEEVVVTGSRIRRIDNETASPVVTISSEYIEKVGFSSVQDVLADLPQNSGGSLDQQQVFGFTPAASGVDLRGAGLGRSLTLMDGKRLPKYPIPAGGTDNFVDTSNIPLGAIERIEVLTSGGSAIYGSDAMGGVVNVILKESFEGVEIKGRLGDTDHGGGQHTNVSLVAGHVTENSNLMFFLENDEKDSVKASQRNNFNNLGSDLASDTFGAYSSYGLSIRNLNGSVATPLPENDCIDRGLQPLYSGSGAYSNCGFNRATRRDLMPDMERTSALLNYSLDLSENLEWYSRLDYTTSESFRNIEPMPVSEYTYYVGEDELGNPDPGFVTLQSDLSGDIARFDQVTGFGGDFAALADGIYWPTRRMIEFGNRRTQTEVDNYTVLTGFRGQFGDGWNYDVDYQFSRTEFSDESPGFASGSGYFDYLASGTNGRSIFDLMTEQEVASAAYLPWSEAESTFTGFSATVDGDIFVMPSGNASVAMGIESYREWFYNTSDPESLAGNILSTGGSSGKGKRDYDAVFVETLFPLLDTVTATLAVRYDNYSDFGNNTSPQATIEYRPTENILIRGLWADTFRAPDMQRVYGDPTAAFDQIVDPYGCELQGGTVDPNSPIASCNGELYVDVAVGPNSELDAETGTNWSVGTVLNFGSFDASIDYWNMEIEDIVNDLSAQQIASDYDIYGSLIVRNTIGEIDSVNATAQNLSFRETTGVDFSTGYVLSFDELGQLRLRLTGTYLLDYDEQFDITSPVEDVMENDRVPEWRAQFAVGWDYDYFSTNLYFNYIGDMNGTNIEDFQGAGIPLTIDDQVKINLSASVALGSFGAQVGVTNLTDEGPEIDPTDFGWPYYPQEYYNAMGRAYYVSMNYKF